VLVVLAVGQRAPDGHLAGNLIFIEIGDAVAFVHLAQPGGHPGVEQDAADQRRLAAAPMADEHEISDFVRVENLHSPPLLSTYFGGKTPAEKVEILAQGPEGGNRKVRGGDAVAANFCQAF